MAKKRQPDFQKIQMKPGRTVARRRNVTSVNIKSKKIIMPSKGSKQNVSAKTIPDCLKIINGNSSGATRTSALDDLNKLIGHRRSSLSSNLADVLDAAFKFVLDVDDNVRSAATSVLESILQFTNDLQIQSFVRRLVNTLSCAMTHNNMRIKENSLTLLTSMIKHHPDLISHCIPLLDHLITMLFGSHRTRTHTQTPKQNLSVMYSDGIYSPHWRVKLLCHIDVLLKTVLKSKSLVMNNDREEQEVYWDSKSPLHLQIYAGSGLKPFDIEKSKCNASQEFHDDSSILMSLYNILEVLPSLFIEETASVSKSDDQLLDDWTISNLNVLFEVLNTLSGWQELLFSDEMKNKLTSFMKVNIYDKQRFPFKKRGVVFGKPEENFHCVQLNLNVCYLYCLYLLEIVENKEDICKTVFSYTKTVFKMSETLKRQSIPVLVKITKIFFGMRETAGEILYDSLLQLCSLLKISDNHPNRNLLTSLFTRMSLDSAYHFVAETDAMKEWYKWLLNNLREIPNACVVDKEVLRVTKKIANRRYPCFQKLLNQIDFPVIKAMLKFDDDDVRDTAIFLIYNMENISKNHLLDDIACIILTDPSLPRKFALRLIRLLTYRFSEKPPKGEIPKESIHSSSGLINMVQFLLNIAVDSLNINNKELTDFEANEYTKSLKIIGDVTSYSILPSLHWKEHSELFEVCFKFLNQLPQVIVNEVATLLFVEILDNRSCLPMHVVISILKLDNPEMGKRYYRLQIQDLIFTALLTASILTGMSMDDDWYECNITELTNSMDLNSQMAIETMCQLESLKDDQLEGIMAYHILRVYRFYNEKNLLNRVDFPRILKIMETLKEKCSDKTFERQPLFVSLYTHFSTYNKHS